MVSIKVSTSGNINKKTNVIIDIYICFQLLFLLLYTLKKKELEKSKIYLRILKFLSIE